MAVIEVKKLSSALAETDPERAGVLCRSRRVHRAAGTQRRREDHFPAHPGFALPTDIGYVRVAGFTLPQQAAAVRRRLGVLSHQTMLYNELTGEENLRFYGKMYNIPNPDQRILEVLDLVNLTNRRGDIVRTYSRGMQQRLAIARAVIHDPEILLLDEPYTGLDQDASTMLDTVLKQIAGQGRTVVMTSHDLARAAALGTRFDVLSRGKIIASAKQEDIPTDGLLAFYRKSIQEPGKTETPAQEANHA